MFCGYWDLGGKKVLKENFDLGVFEGGCRVVFFLIILFVFYVAGIFADVLVYFFSV